MEKPTSLKIMILADGRSPIVQNWVKMLAPLNYHITLVSSYPCNPLPGINHLFILPLAFSSMGGSQAGGNRNSGYPKVIKHFRPLAQKIRHWLGPWTLQSKVNRFRDLISVNQPDLIHAFRIPYEGMLAGLTNPDIPVIISTWGNDFTLHAPSTRRMGALTRHALTNASALISDTHVDIQRAVEWGFDLHQPTLVVPGNGGIDLAEIQDVIAGVIRSTPFRVINPRGLRSYIRTDTFFTAIPFVLKELPEVQFTCTSMRGQPEAEMWVHKLGIEKNVQLLPLLSQTELWREFARSQVSVSVSSHDGTPNTLLEAMAMGCLPICGDLPSIREWIVPGENGLLIDPGNPEQLANNMINSLKNEAMRQAAAQRNLQIIKERADIHTVRQVVSDFYPKVTSGGKK